jgi:hypothetical protein
VDAKNETHGSMKFPRTYLKQQRDEKNLFSLTLSDDHIHYYLPIKWTSLDACRKYSFEMKSEYSKIWSSAPHFWETFTSQEGSSPQMPFLKNNQIFIFCFIGRRPIDKKYDFRYCSESEGFYCRNIVYHNQQYYLRVFGDRAGCLNKNQICDGHSDCDYGFDEQNCDDNVNRRFHVCIKHSHYSPLFVCYGPYMHPTVHHWIQVWPTMHLQEKSVRWCIRLC